MMDIVGDQVDKELVPILKEKEKDKTVKCNEKSLNVGEFVNQQHEIAKDLKIYVKAKERNNRRRLQNLFLSIIITLMFVIFVNIGIEIFKTWYFDGYNEYDFDYKTEFWTSLAAMLFTLR